MELSIQTYAIATGLIFVVSFLFAIAVTVAGVRMLMTSGRDEPGEKLPARRRMLVGSVVGGFAGFIGGLLGLGGGLHHRSDADGNEFFHQGGGRDNRFYRDLFLFLRFSGAHGRGAYRPDVCHLSCSPPIPGRTIRFCACRPALMTSLASPYRWIPCGTR